jgi:hypothetical protein
MRRIALLVLVVLVLVACSTPGPLVSGGGAGSDQATKSFAATMEPQIALTQPGAIGGATNSQVKYVRLDDGTQAAPQFSLNLQPGAGATVAGTYPELRVISPIFIVFASNAQRESTLTAEQIAALEKVAREATAGATSIIGASKTVEAAPVPVPK